MLRTFLAFWLLFNLNAARAQPLTPVVVGMTGAMTDVGFYVADKRGFFRDEGLDVKLTVFDSAARMITLFASGALDVGGGGPSAGLYNAVARGVDIRVVADKNQTVPGRGAQFVVVRKDLVDNGRYKSLADLRGMKIVSPAPGGSSTTTLDKVFEAAGITVNDVERVFMPLPQQVAALANKAVDGALMGEPMVSEVVKLGIGARVLADDMVYPNHQVAVVLYSGRFAKNGDAGRRFMRAYLRGVRAYSAAIVDTRFFGPEGEAIVSIIAEYSHLKNAEVTRGITPAALDPDGALHMPSLREDLEIFRRQGLIDGTVTVEQAVDVSFAQTAARELGPYRAPSGN
jgi:NitT/TauT family transport system substrate-binding protein